MTGQGPRMPSTGGELSRGGGVVFSIAEEDSVPGRLMEPIRTLWEKNEKPLTFRSVVMICVKFIRKPAIRWISRCDQVWMIIRANSIHYQGSDFICPKCSLVWRSQSTCKSQCLWLSSQETPIHLADDLRMYPKALSPHKDTDCHLTQGSFLPLKPLGRIFLLWVLNFIY